MEKDVFYCFLCVCVLDIVTQEVLDGFMSKFQSWDSGPLDLDFWTFRFLPREKAQGDISDPFYAHKSLT